MRLVYLASPYSNGDKEIRAQRLAETRECLAFFAQRARGICLYSPIAHWADIAVGHDLPEDVGYWLEQDFHMIRQSTAMWILTIEGWQESYGIRQEIEFAESIHRDILYIIREETSFVLTDAICDDATYRPRRDRSAMRV